MPAGGDVRVVVSDMQPVYSHGLVSVLNSAEGILATTISGVSSRIASELMEFRADVVVIGSDDAPDVLIDRVQRIRDQIPGLKILVVIDPDHAEGIGEYVRADGISLLSRRADLEDAIETVRASAAGRVFVATDIAPRILEELSVAVKRADARWRPGGLTRRELEVLRFVADGLQNRDVASALHISENTVKNHMRNIHEKLGVKTRTEAVVKAAKDGLFGSRFSIHRPRSSDGYDSQTRRDSVKTANK